VPSCDLAALDILDEMYLDPEYTDPYYSTRRKNSILAGYDCHSILENCHCTAYGVNPWPGKNADLTIARLDKEIFIRFHSQKGMFLKKELEKHITFNEASENDIIRIEELRSGQPKHLCKKTKNFPALNYQAGL
jgi:sulfhydrogenase subunit beta (sulfur reductase)